MHRVETLAITLTSSLLEWLRELPTRRLLHMLKLIAELLRKHGDQVWPGTLAELASNLRSAHESSDRDDLVDAMQRILSCFGATRSLSDLHLSPQNGHKIKTEEIDSVNARFGALRTQLYLSARQAIARVESQRRLT
jgi:hypothetical protein